MKRKILILITFFFVLASCSGFVINKESGKGGTTGVSYKLALVGGGYLSSDNFNEISPFLYRDPLTGQAYLFFSSDRDGGNYRIFYAKMTADGLFYPPVELDSNINVPGFDQLSPLVFNMNVFVYNPEKQAYDTSSELVIGFLSTNSTNCSLSSFFIDSNFISISNIPGIVFSKSVATGMGLIPDTYASSPPTILIYDGSAAASQYYLYQYAPVSWYASEGGGPSFPQNVSSGNGFIAGDSLLMLQGSGSQISSGYYIYGYDTFPANETNGVWNIGTYGSASRDRDPDVDADGYKVYFASDRLGKGNFDLYRYNDNTFDRQTVLLPPSPFYSVISSPTTNIDTNNVTNVIYWTQLFWGPVLGAKGYNIYYSTTQDSNLVWINFNRLASGIAGTNYLWLTNYFDFTNTNYQSVIDIRIYSYNGSGESAFGGDAQQYYNQSALAGASIRLIRK